MPRLVYQRRGPALDQRPRLVRARLKQPLQLPIAGAIPPPRLAELADDVRLGLTRHDLLNHPRVASVDTPLLSRADHRDHDDQEPQAQERKHTGTNDACRTAPGLTAAFRFPGAQTTRTGRARRKACVVRSASIRRA